LFFGDAQGFAGLNQVNVRMPANASGKRGLRAADVSGPPGQRGDAERAVKALF